MYQRIFVPVNGSETCAVILEETRRLACALHAKVCLAEIIDTSQFAEDPIELVHQLHLAEPQRQLDENREEFRRYLAANAQSLQQAGIETETRLLEKYGGKVSKAIVQAAEEWGAQLIVMGTHGRSGLQHLLMGSVAEEVIHHTRIPILLLHIPPDDE